MISPASVAVPKTSDQQSNKNIPDFRNPAINIAISSYGLRDLLNTLFREKQLIFWVFLVTIVIGTAIALQLKSTYTAQARIMVLPSREYTLNPVLGESPPGIILGDERIVRSETEILKNVTLINQVIESLGIDRLYPDMGSQSLFSLLANPVRNMIYSWFKHDQHLDEIEKSANPNAADYSKLLHNTAIRFQKNLDIFTVKDASVISLSFSHPQADLAISALNNLILAYLDFRTQTLFLPRSKLYTEQRDGFAQRLQRVEQDIEAFKLQNNISVFADQRSLLMRQQAEINSSRLDTETNFREVEGRINNLHKQLTFFPKQIPLYSEKMVQDSSETARSILVALEARRNELLTKFNPTSQFIADLDEQIAKIRPLINSTPPKKINSQRMGPNPIYGEINTDLVRQEIAASALRAKLASLVQQFEQLTAQLEKFNKLEKTYNMLVLDRELLEKNFRIYSQKVEESILEEEHDRQKMANVRIIEQPQTLEPRSAKWAVLVFSIIGAIMLALLIAFFKDFFREVFISPEDMERSLRLPVLVAIPINEKLAKPAADCMSNT